MWAVSTVLKKNERMGERKMREADTEYIKKFILLFTIIIIIILLFI